jgi:hypothetical protein
MAIPPRSSIRATTKPIKEGNPFPHEDLYSSKNINSIRKAIEDEID